MGRTQSEQTHPKILFLFRGLSYPISTSYFEAYIPGPNSSHVYALENQEYLNWILWTQRRLTWEQNKRPAVKCLGIYNCSRSNAKIMNTCLPGWVSSALFWFLTFITPDSFMFLDVLSSHTLQAAPLNLLLPPSYSFNLSYHSSEFHFCPLNYF